MADTRDLYYEPDEEEELSTAVVTAVAQAHDEDVIEQQWVMGESINTDALDGLFQERNLRMTIQFEADSAIVTIIADPDGNPRIKIEPYR